jgi:hypothetical protein
MEPADVDPALLALASDAFSLAEQLDHDPDDTSNLATALAAAAAKQRAAGFAILLAAFGGDRFAAEHVHLRAVEQETFDPADLLAFYAEHAG